MQDQDFETLYTCMEELENHLIELRTITNNKQKIIVGESLFSSIFRGVNKIKATSKLARLNQEVNLASALENLLIFISRNNLIINKEIISIIDEFNEEFSSSIEEMKRSAFYISNYSSLERKIYLQFLKLRNNVELKELSSDKKVLIIDDDADLTSYLKNLIEKELGFKSDVASDGLKGIRCAKEKYYQLIICDLKMPFLPGDKCLNYIRNINELNQDSNIILMTAYDLSDLRINNYDNVFFLKKPLDKDKVLKYSQYSLVG